MNVTFLNPPFHPMFSRESRSPCVTKSSTLYWPMFLSYAAGVCEADGNEIQLIDSPAMELDLPQTLEGTHATAEPLESMEMEPSLDYVVIGEADYTCRNLVRALRGDGAPVGQFAGLAYRTAEGKVDFQPEGPKIENLNEIPWVSKVYRKHLYSCYKKYFYGANLNPLIVILSGRGCPNHCSYCVIPQTLNGHKFRRRDPKDVVDELQYIKENFEDLGEVFFEDDTFTASHEHVRQICNLILERNLSRLLGAATPVLMCRSICSSS